MKLFWYSDHDCSPDRHFPGNQVRLELLIRGALGEMACLRCGKRDLNAVRVVGLPPDEPAVPSNVVPERGVGFSYRQDESPRSGKSCLNVPFAHPTGVSRILQVRPIVLRPFDCCCSDACTGRWRLHARIATQCQQIRPVTSDVGSATGLRKEFRLVPMICGVDRIFFWKSAALSPHRDSCPSRGGRLGIHFDLVCSRFRGTLSFCEGIVSVLFVCAAPPIGSLGCSGIFSSGPNFWGIRGT